MRKLIYLAIGLFLIGCASSVKTTAKKDTQLPEGAVSISNEELDYELIIIDIGFETYLATTAKPESFYSQDYYELKNKFYVIEWNIRAQNPFNYDSSIYENEINYDATIDYGLEVNYKLFNYFKFVEYKYKQRFF